MTGRGDNALIKSVTGLEGGCVACGATCGVVSAGALALALWHEADIQARGWDAKQEVLVEAGDFARWFAAAYGSFLCRERTRADFYSKWGQLKYFLTFYRMAGCFWHIRGAMRRLYDHQAACAPAVRQAAASVAEAPCLHCAEYVLENIRKQTGIGNRRLENLAFVFDGGVGLTGGLCGALAGAVMGVNILVGLPVREQSFWKTATDFGVGHINLVTECSFGSKEPFLAGKQVVREFKHMAGAFECEKIIGRRFKDPSAFQEYIRASATCRTLMDRMVDAASAVIRSHQGGV